MIEDNGQVKRIKIYYTKDESKLARIELEDEEGKIIDTGDAGISYGGKPKAY